MFDRFRRGALPLHRIEAFSDGVFAIIVTLLVLDLKVPVLQDAYSVQDLSHGLRDQMPRFFSWLLSFIIVCKFWLNHHYLLSLARHADYAMVWLNALFLMFVSFVPFPTAMMGAYPNNPLAVTLFGVVMAFNTLLFMILQAYIMRTLMKPEAAEAVDPNIILKSFVGPMSYLMGSAAAWYSVFAAFAIYLLTPLFFIVPPATSEQCTEDVGR